MNVQADLLYTPTHEWVKFQGENTALVGLSDFAQQSLSDLVFITLPVEGDDIIAGEALGDVESVKAVSDIISPVTGVVDVVNEEVDQKPELINRDPYGSWLIKVTEVSARAELMDAAAYEVYLSGLGG
jgi:glycine cleavage system H protein